MNITANTVDRYTTEVYVGNRTIRLTDRGAIARDQAEMKRSRKIKAIKIASKVCIAISQLASIVGFFYLIGIAGHSDFVTEMHIVDDWSTFTYFTHFLCSVAIFCTSAILNKLGHVIRRLTKYVRR